MILDTQSLNGTWVSLARFPRVRLLMAGVKVNKRRLADGEVRVLTNGDRVTFTPLPFDIRLSAKRDCVVYVHSRLGNNHPLEFVYKKYAMDDFQATLSDSGNTVRRSFSELRRFRKILETVRSSRYVSCWYDMKSLPLTFSLERLPVPQSRAQAAASNQRTEAPWIDRIDLRRHSSYHLCRLT